MINKKIFRISLVIAAILMISMFSAVRITTRADKLSTETLLEDPTTQPPTEPPLNETPPTEPPFPLYNCSWQKPLPSEYPRKIPTTVDDNRNRVHDGLDEIILEATEDDNLSKYVKVSVILTEGSFVTADDIANFESFGGNFTKVAFDCNQFGGEMACNKIYDYVASSDRISLVQPNLPASYCTGSAIK